MSTLAEAASWLGYTYLYVRMLCNPQLYGVPLDALDADALLEVRGAEAGGRVEGGGRWGGWGVGGHAGIPLGAWDADVLLQVGGGG